MKRFVLCLLLIFAGGSLQGKKLILGVINHEQTTKDVELAVSRDRWGRPVFFHVFVSVDCMVGQKNYKRVELVFNAKSRPDESHLYDRAIIPRHHHLALIFYPEVCHRESNGAVRFELSDSQTVETLVSSQTIPAWFEKFVEDVTFVFEKNYARLIDSPCVIL